MHARQPSNLDRATLATLLTLASCSGPARVETSVPDDVRWLALAEIDVAGRLDHASGLTRWDGNALPVFASDDAPVVLLGYTDAQISESAGAGASPLILAREALQPALTCQPALPDPAWSARWEAEATLAPASLDALGRLTASWVDASCPASYELALDVDCRDVRCAVSPARSGCAFEVDLSSCDLGSARGAVETAGLCVAIDPIQRVCEAITGPPLAVRTERCTSSTETCTFFWYLGDGPELAQHMRVDLRLGPPWSPSGARREGALDPALLDMGYAWDLAPLGLDALVSTTGGPPRETCDPVVPGVLAVTNGASIALTATAPPCLLELASVPEQDSVVGIFAAADGWRAGRFDTSARLIASAPVDPRPAGTPADRRPDTREWRPFGLVRAGDRWIAGFRRLSDDGALLVALDDALSSVARSDLGTLDAGHLAARDADTVVITQRSSGRLVAWSPGGPMRDRALLVGASGREAEPLYPPLALPQLTVVASGEPPALHTVTPEGMLGRAMIFDEDARPMLAVRAPWDPELIAVFGGHADHSSTLSAFSLATRRFSPGTITLASSPITRVVPDGHRRLWALAAWTGEVILLEQPR